MNNVLINLSELERYGATTPLSSLAFALLNQQKQNWQLCGNNYNALSDILIKKFYIGNNEIKVQYNPGRIKSTAAKVDKVSVKERKCFLCLENLPPEQRGIPFGSDFLILCNPFPIFKEHFTIIKKTHVPQTISGNFRTFLELLKSLGDKLTVFYNGPECGASAPDHMHFQAGTRNAMPLENEYELLSEKYGKPLIQTGKNKLTAVDDNLRKMFFIESDDSKVAEELFDILFLAMQKIQGTDEEPMMNIIGNFENNKWKLVVFPRAKHRPAYFFLDEPERIMVSPAAVDMSGLIIVPREQDFEKLDEEKIHKIYSEVCLNKNEFEKLASMLAG